MLLSMKINNPFVKTGIDIVLSVATVIGVYYVMNLVLKMPFSFADTDMWSTIAIAVAVSVIYTFERAGKADKKAISAEQ